MCIASFSTHPCLISGYTVLTQKPLTTTKEHEWINWWINVWIKEKSCIKCYQKLWNIFNIVSTVDLPNKKGNRTPVSWLVGHCFNASYHHIWSFLKKWPQKSILYSIIAFHCKIWCFQDIIKWEDSHHFIVSKSHQDSTFENHFYLPCIREFVKPSLNLSNNCIIMQFYWPYLIDKKWKA